MSLYFSPKPVLSLDRLTCPSPRHWLHFIYCIYLVCLFHHVAVEDRGQLLGIGSLPSLSGTLGTKLRLSVSAAGAFTCSVISPAPDFCLEFHFVMSWLAFNAAPNPWVYSFDFLLSAVSSLVFTRLMLGDPQLRLWKIMACVQQAFTSLDYILCMSSELASSPLNLVVFVHESMPKARW